MTTATTVCLVWSWNSASPLANHNDLPLKVVQLEYVYDIMFSVNRPLYKNKIALKFLICPQQTLHLSGGGTKHCTDPGHFQYACHLYICQCSLSFISFYENILISLLSFSFQLSLLVSIFLSSNFSSLTISLCISLALHPKWHMLWWGRVD